MASTAITAIFPSQREKVNGGFGARAGKLSMKHWGLATEA
jgi:hypothetical protein